MTTHSDTKTCRICHIEKSISSYYRRLGSKDGLRSDCVQCVRKKTEAWYNANREVCVKNSKRWHFDNKDRQRDMRLQRKYGVSSAWYAATADKQNQKCAVCGDPGVAVRRLSVDHAHDTGVVRGLLCMLCNTAIGKLKDSPTVLASALRYLHRHGKALSTDEVAELVNLHQSPHQET